MHLPKPSLLLYNSTNFMIMVNVSTSCEMFKNENHELSPFAALRHTLNYMLIYIIYNSMSYNKEHQQP